MDYTALIARMDEQRAQWLDLVDFPGKRLRFLRPLETDIHGMRAKTLRDIAESAAEFVDDWSGFTEATLLGDAVGSDQPVAFHRALFVRWLRDRTEVVAALGEAIKASIDAYVAARDQSRKK